MKLPVVKPLARSIETKHSDDAGGREQRPPNVIPLRIPVQQKSDPEAAARELRILLGPPNLFPFPNSSFLNVDI